MLECLNVPRSAYHPGPASPGGSSAALRSCCGGAPAENAVLAVGDVLFENWHFPLCPGAGGMFAGAAPDSCGRGRRKL